MMFSDLIKAITLEVRIYFEVDKKLLFTVLEVRIANIL